METIDSQIEETNQADEHASEFTLFSFPDEVVMAILSFMTAEALNNLSLCSVFSQHLANANELWHRLFTRDKPGVHLISLKPATDNDSEEFEDLFDPEGDFSMIKSKTKIALFNRLKQLFWKNKQAENEGEKNSDQEPPLKKIKLDESSEKKEDKDEDKGDGEPMEVEKPAIIDVAADFYNWKSIYIQARNFTSIQEAIDSANDGDTIIIGPGLYKEGILIEKNLTILGNDFESIVEKKNIERIKHLKKVKKEKDEQEAEKKKEEGKEEAPKKIERVIEAWEQNRVIICSSRYNTVEMPGEYTAYIKNVAIQQAVKPPSKCFGVCVDKGTLTLDNCEVDSTSLSTIIGRKESTLNIKNCWISHSQQIGVFTVSSTANVHGSVFEDTLSYAVAALDGSTLTLENNKLMDCGGIKVGEHSNTPLQINNNEFTNQTWSALRLEKIPHLELRNNIVQKGNALGLTLKDIKFGQIEGNKITDNVKSGIILIDSENCTITNNVISGNGDCGVDAKSVKNVTITNNIVENNLMSGVDLYGSAVVLEGNTISNNDTGIYAFHQCAIELRNNTLTKNKTNGIEIRIGVPVLAGNISGNRTEYNGANGIIICRRNDDEAAAIDTEFISANNKLMGNANENLFVEVKKYAFDSELNLSFTVNEKERNEITADVEEAIKRGVCTFSYTGYHFHPQYWWQCQTCSLMAGKGFCAVCKDTCHKGHNVNPEPRFSGFYCDCGSERRCI